MKAVATTKSIAPDLEKNIDILTAGALRFFNSIFRQLAIHQNVYVHQLIGTLSQLQLTRKWLLPTIRQFKLMYHIR
ncbi:MAG: hypothetical protein M3044_00505 [Thermoproteota archaeon]|nr:hypothetical protein [Thermoproteota archaeon]